MIKFYLNNIKRINGKCLKCDIGWIYFEGNCFLISNDETKKWTESLNFCLSKKSKLIDIDKSEFRNYPTKLFNLIKYLKLNKTFWVV